MELSKTISVMVCTNKGVVTNVLSGNDGRNHCGFCGEKLSSINIASDENRT